MGAEHQQPNVLSRRRFIEMSGSLLAGAVVNHYLGGEVQAQTEQPTFDLGEPLDQVQQNSSMNESPSIIHTVFESQAVLAAELIAAPLVEKMGIKVGNAYIEKLVEDAKQDAAPPQLDNSTVATVLLAAGVVQPIREELIFRGLPQLFLRKRPGNQWKVGIPSALAFAFSHNLIKDRTTGRYSLTLNRIPLPQFASGLYYWKIMRERGFIHAPVAHVSMNSAMMSVVGLIYHIAGRDAGN